MNVRLTVLGSLVPISQNAGLLEAVLHTPRANVTKEREDVAPLRQATLELFTALKALPQSLELPEGVLIRKHHVDAAGVCDVCSVPLREEILAGWDVLLVVLREEFEASDPANGLEKIIDRSRSLQDEHVFGDDAGGSGLELHASRLERPLQFQEPWSQTLLLTVCTKLGGAGTATAFLGPSR